MDHIQTWLENLYDHIQDDWDRIIPVIGTEGVGKSTLILEMIWLYNQHRNIDPDPASVMSHVVFDSRDAFRDELIGAAPGDPIAVMDAAHILHNMDVMMPDQKETERSLLDIRTENYVIFLGYQDWGDIPKGLRSRRAENALRIPRRGLVYGYNRKQLDEKYDDLGKNEWPDPALRDTFPDLEGTELWERFNEIDRERKRRRLQEDKEDSDDRQSPQEVATEILRGDVGEYVEFNEFQERAYIDKSLIKFDFPDLSDQEADQVRSAVRREIDIMDYVTQDVQEETET